MPQKSIVLVTGSSGRIGQAVVRELVARGHAVRGYDRVATSGLDDCVLGDITDGQALLRAAEGVGTIVHLAATPDDADFMTELLGPNIVGVYQIMEAARLAKVQRLILASSGQVVWHQRLTGPWPIGTDVPVSPRYWYAAAKVFLEAAGRAYVDAHHIPSVIAVRLGWCPRTPEQVQEISENDWAQDVYLSPRDAGRFFACAVEAQAEIPFAIVYATSKAVKLQRYDLVSSMKLLGYEPHERWPEGIEEVVAKR
jgi:NAD(P)-dependent dehydrogenase (short-subunit alcohol dehydrogenase family)